MSDMRRLGARTGKEQRIYMQSVRAGARGCECDLSLIVSVKCEGASVTTRELNGGARSVRVDTDVWWLSEEFLGGMA